MCSHPFIRYNTGIFSWLLSATNRSLLIQAKRHYNIQILFSIKQFYSFGYFVNGANPLQRYFKSGLYLKFSTIKNRIPFSTGSSFRLKPLYSSFLAIPKLGEKQSSTKLLMRMHICGLSSLVICSS